jgi:hypothetical protein
VNVRFIRINQMPANARNVSVNLALLANYAAAAYAFYWLFDRTPLWVACLPLLAGAVLVYVISVYGRPVPPHAAAQSPPSPQRSAAAAAASLPPVEPETPR